MSGFEHRAYLPPRNETVPDPNPSLDQQPETDFEITACVSLLPPRFLRDVILSCSIPLNPLKPMTLTSHFERVFNHCMAIWNLPGQSILFTKDFIVQSFREAAQSYITRTDVAASFDLLGPLTAPLYIRLTLKVTCDLILIFQQLFWATPRKRILTKPDLDSQLRSYKGSRVRQRIHQLVDGSVGAFDIITSFQPEKLKQVIGNVVESGHVLVLEELRGKCAAEGREMPLAELPG
ncbi:hypothetical protein GP486_006230 [Trichoglossum hirsutum]|uniref:Uncharacterized protein n=1 Tax=Trichoglossum hirsutum TaxID=265104 RepID=A0A9P8IIV3_9PEZI|nr:hypothetical protein GP486_006230 [Trichoglossum hirsutum]